MKRYQLTLWSLLLSLTCGAQHIKLVNDIVPGGQGSTPNHLSVFQNKLVFYADGVGGIKPWSLDASEVLSVHGLGTSPGFFQSYAWYAPYMVQCDNQIFFAGNDGTLGTELYTWDGANANSALAYDVYSGANSSNVNEMVSVNNKLYITALSPLTGNELYVYDPATHTGQLAIDCAPGSQSSFPTRLTALNGKIYFWYTTSTYTYAFMAYNTATNTGTQLCLPGAGNAMSDNFYINGKFYFVHTTGTYGAELYSIDTFGTFTRLTDIIPGSGDGIFCSQHERATLAVYNNKIYFIAHDNNIGQELWQYNPATNAASKVATINTYPSSYPTYPVSRLYTFNNKLYFNGDDGTHGDELWVYDGVNAPHMIQDLNPGATGSSPTDMINFNNRLYFQANTLAYGRELYRLTDTQANIARPFTDTALCAGNVFNLSFTTDDTFQSGNTFTIQLSDASGSFSSPVNIGSLNATYSGTISCTIPVSTAAGAAYKLRILSTNPARISDDELPPIRIGTGGAATITLAAAPGTTITAGDTIHFTTTITNGGSSPAYTWLKNATLIPGVNTAAYNTNLLANSDNICAVLVSNDVCATPNTANSCLTINVNPAGIPKTGEANDLRLYPNPNNGRFTLTGKNDGSAGIIEVTNIYGQSVYTLSVAAGKQSLNESLRINLPDGIYLLQVKTEATKRTIKFTVGQ